MPSGDTLGRCCWSWLRAWAEVEGTVLLSCCHNPFILRQQPTSPTVLGHNAERRNRNVTSALRSFQAKYLLCAQRASLLRPPISCLFKASTLICKLKRSILICWLISHLEITSESVLTCGSFTVSCDFINITWCKMKQGIETKSTQEIIPCLVLLVCDMNKQQMSALIQNLECS